MVHTKLKVKIFIAIKHCISIIVPGKHFKSIMAFIYRLHFSKVKVIFEAVSKVHVGVIQDSELPIIRAASANQNK